jgi:uncharacterized protein involved in outer membrane biogenesis
VPEKSRLLRNLLIGAAAAIAGVIVLLLAAPLVIPSDFIAGQIAALVRQKTGRALHIAGPISFSLLPRVALVAHDVALASPQGGFSADFLTVKTADVTLRPLALLHGAIEIDQLRLSEPVVNFEVNKDGLRNWIFRTEVAPRSTASSTARAAPAPSFATGDITIANGTVGYLDQRDGLKRSATGLNMRVSLPSFDGPLKASGTTIYNGQAVNLTTTVASPGELRDGRTSPVTINLTSSGASFSFQGTIERGDLAKATGTVDFKAPSLRDFLTWTQIGTTLQDSDLGPLSIDGNINVGEDKFSLTEATVAFDSITAKGPFALSHSDGRLELDFTEVTLLGGKGTGKIVVDTKGPTPNIAATVRLAGITVHQLSFNIAGFDKLSGTGDVSVDLTTSGKTMHDLIASLNGSGSIALTDGTVGSAALGPLMKNSVGALLGDKTIPREIGYRSLSASATIAKGVLHNNDLKLSGPKLSATGAGTLDLAQRLVDFQWDPDIAGLGSARIAINGAWDNPDYKVQSVNITNGKGLSIPGLKLR